MNNKQNNTNRSLLDQQRGTATGMYQDFLKGVGGDLSSAREGSNALRGQIAQRYSDSNNFMPSGLKPNSSGWFDLPNSGGGSGGADFSNARSGYQKFADTGGDFDESRAAVKSIGFNPEALRLRTSSIIPSFYQGYKNQLARRNSVQGGYSPGFDSSMSEIGRQAGREGFNASRQVEGDIADKELGASQARASGLTNIDQLIQSGKLSGLRGLESIGQTEASLGESAANRNQAMQLALQKMYQEGNMSSASGLMDLYRSAPGDVGQSLQAYLSGLGNMSGNQLQNLSTRSQIQDRSWLDMIPGLVGAAGGVFAGMGGMGGKTPTSSGSSASIYNGGFAPRNTDIWKNIRFETQ